MEVNKKYRVLITGFGPFDDHIVNASWQAVKELSKLCTDSKDMTNVEVIAKEIPVSYEDVATYIPMLWQKYTPTVVVHVGVSRKAHCLTIERCARSSGYVRPDVFNKCPDESNIESGILETTINVEQICDTVNKNSEKTKCNACVSYDAGRYLCEYIFYKSLRIAPRKTLFVHVPDFNRYSIAQTAGGLYNILCCVIKDMETNKQ